MREINENDFLKHKNGYKHTKRIKGIKVNVLFKDYI